MTNGWTPLIRKFHGSAMFKRLQENLNKREEAGILRLLKLRPDGADFYSNDYLGFAGNKELQSLLLKQVSERPYLLSGSTGSRLISGNSIVVTETEKFIAHEHGYPSALLFSSGYNANLALFSTLPGRHSTVIVDEHIHRSVHDACQMSYAKKLKFRHNDPEDLEQILRRQTGECFIAIESLYSMDGDLAPIEEIAALAEKYDAVLVVDEAHAFGVFGYGLVEKYHLKDKISVVLITYGKALGAHGAAILCDESTRSYLINFASPLIYTTSSQDFQWVSIKTGYEFLKANEQLPIQLQENIRIFRQQAMKTPSSEHSPVQAIIIPEHERLKALQQTLLQEGFLTYPVYSPAVRPGTERLRICLHSFNTEKEIMELAGIIKSFINKS